MATAIATRWLLECVRLEPTLAINRRHSGVKPTRRAATAIEPTQRAATAI